MKTRFLALTALAVASFAPHMFGQTAAAVDPATRHTQMLTKMLGLTSDQQTKVQDLLTKEGTASASLQSQLKTLRTSLLTAIKTNDVGGINSITQQMAAPQQQEAALRASTAAGIYAVLTADQQAKVNNGVEMLAGMGGGRGPGGPGGFDPGMHRGGRPQ